MFETIPDCYTATRRTVVTTTFRLVTQSSPRHLSNPLTSDRPHLSMPPKLMFLEHILITFGRVRLCSSTVKFPPSSALPTSHNCPKHVSCPTHRHLSHRIALFLLLDMTALTHKHLYYNCIPCHAPEDRLSSLEVVSSSSSSTIRSSRKFSATVPGTNPGRHI
jgi:hypothetical protein